VVVMAPPQNAQPPGTSTMFAAHRASAVVEYG
jgi:hypothetical protein